VGLQQAVPLDVFEALAQEAASHASGGRPSGVWAAWRRFTHGGDHPAGAAGLVDFARVTLFRFARRKRKVGT
jgi:hypothetical protein